MGSSFQASVNPVTRGLRVFFALRKYRQSKYSAGSGEQYAVAPQCEWRRYHPLGFKEAANEGLPRASISTILGVTPWLIVQP